MVFDVKLEPKRLEEGRSECRGRERTHARVAHGFCMADVDCTNPLCRREAGGTALVLMHDEGRTREKRPTTRTQVKKSTLYVSVARTGITIISNISCSISELCGRRLNVQSAYGEGFDMWREYDRQVASEAQACTNKHLAKNQYVSSQNTL